MPRNCLGKANTEEEPCIPQREGNQPRGWSGKHDNRAGLACLSNSDEAVGAQGIHYVPWTTRGEAGGINLSHYRP